MSDLFEFEKKLHRFAVMGNPVNHSKSPQIHAEFARQTSQHVQYDAIHVDLGGFTQAVRNFQANGGSGLNVTVPFKLEAFELADKVSERAKLAGAVNTLIFHKDGDISGDNTDGFGLVYDMTEHLQWSLENKNVLILGAGGATRGILAPILEQKTRSVFIANRTASKAKDLADSFSGFGNISAGGFIDIANQAFDIIINATSASIQGELPPLPENIIHEHCKCYDLMYGKEDTAFIRWAKQQQAEKTADGLGMLVGQAAESFYQWLGVRPQIKAVIELIRSAA